MNQIVGKGRLLFGMAAMVLLAGAMPATATAGTPDADSASAETVDLGDHHLVIEDATVRIADTHVDGPGLPEKSVDQAEYTVDETVVSTDGFVARFDGHDIRVGAITVGVDNVGLVLEDVSIGESGP